MNLNVCLTSDTNLKAPKLLDPVVTTPTPHGLMQFHHMSRLKIRKKAKPQSRCAIFLGLTNRFDAKSWRYSAVVASSTSSS